MGLFLFNICTRIVSNNFSIVVIGTIIIYKILFIMSYTTSLGMNSSMFANCSLFCDVRHVQSSVLGQNVMFGSVRNSVRLLCDQTK